jgi:hypothetical protein
VANATQADTTSQHLPEVVMMSRTAELGETNCCLLFNRCGWSTAAARQLQLAQHCTLPIKSANIHQRH